MRVVCASFFKICQWLFSLHSSVLLLPQEELILEMRQLSGDVHILSDLKILCGHLSLQVGLRDVESADFWQKESGGSSLLPTTLEEFMRSIIEVHYVDVGLNCQGAYQTDPHVLEGLAQAAQVRDPGLLIAFHGTPRQWQDRFRRWVVQEKDRCVGLLQDAACKHGDGKLQVSETFYFAGRRASLQMHFEIIEALIVS